MAFGELRQIRLLGILQCEPVGAVVREVTGDQDMEPPDVADRLWFHHENRLDVAAETHEAGRLEGANEIAARTQPRDEQFGFTGLGRQFIGVGIGAEAFGIAGLNLDDIEDEGLVGEGLDVRRPLRLFRFDLHRSNDHAPFDAQHGDAVA